MTSEGKGVDTEAIDIKWYVKKTLNSICMKIGPMLMSAGCKVGDRLNRSRFVVGEHYRNEGNRIVHHAGEGFRLNNSMAVGQNQIGGKASGMKQRNVVEHRIVFDRRDENTRAMLI